MSKSKYILDSYKYYDYKKGLVRYNRKRMKQLCDVEEREYYVSPFQKIGNNSMGKEYIYNTFTRDGMLVQTCGIILDIGKNERLINL